MGTGFRIMRSPGTGGLVTCCCVATIAFTLFVFRWNVKGKIADARTVEPATMRIAVKTDGAVRAAGTFPVQCKHTNANAHFVADSSGHVCTRQEQDARTRCCTSSSIQFSCDGCQPETRCCSDLEYCVSCCLSQMKDETREALKSAPRFRRYTLRDEDDFDLCEIGCKSSSESVVHENAYRSKQHHCFGPLPPPDESSKMPDADMYMFVQPG